MIPLNTYLGKLGKAPSTATSTLYRNKIPMNFICGASLGWENLKAELMFIVSLPDKVEICLFSVSSSPISPATTKSLAAKEALE